MKMVLTLSSRPGMSPENRKTNSRSASTSVRLRLDVRHGPLDVKNLSLGMAKFLVEGKVNLELLQKACKRLTRVGEKVRENTALQEQLANDMQRNLDPENRHILNFQRKCGKISFKKSSKTHQNVERIGLRPAEPSHRIERTGLRPAPNFSKSSAYASFGRNGKTGKTH